jgi:hypothetical protein
MVLCAITTCYSVESAWYRRWKLNLDNLVSNTTFNFSLRRYDKETMKKQTPFQPYLTPKLEEVGLTLPLN